MGSTIWAEALETQLPELSRAGVLPTRSRPTRSSQRNKLSSRVPLVWTICCGLHHTSSRDRRIVNPNPGRRRLCMIRLAATWGMEMGTIRWKEKEESGLHAFPMQRPRRHARPPCRLLQQGRKGRGKVARRDAETDHVQLCISLLRCGINTAGNLNH
jgi:hypothetical protein